MLGFMLASCNTRTGLSVAANTIPRVRRKDAHLLRESLDNGRAGAVQDFCDKQKR